MFQQSDFPTPRILGLAWATAFSMDREVERIISSWNDGKAKISFMQLVNSKPFGPLAFDAMLESLNPDVTATLRNLVKKDLNKKLWVVYCKLKAEKGLRRPPTFNPLTFLHACTLDPAIFSYQAEEYCVQEV